MVEELLETSKVDVDSKDNDCDRTPLPCAAVNEQKAITKLLLEMGKMDIDSKDRHGWIAGIVGCGDWGTRLSSSCCNLSSRLKNKIDVAILLQQLALIFGTIVEFSNSSTGISDDIVVGQDPAL